MTEQPHTGNENIAPEEGESDSQGLKTEKSQKDIELEQEAELRAKYPAVKGPGTSALLQKRLSQKTKFFDSGDYAMAKAKGRTAVVGVGGGAASCKQPSPVDVNPPDLIATTGEAIPTPETVTHRKTTNRLSKLVSMS